MRAKLPYVYLFLAIFTPILAIAFSRNCPCAKMAPVGGASSTSVENKTAQKSATIETRIGQIDENIDAKLVNIESPAESDIASEIAELDSILANPRGVLTTSELAKVLAYKARVYLNALNMPDKAVATYKQVVEKYPATDAAAKYEAFVTKAERWKRLAAVQATLTPGTVFPPFAVKNLQGNALTLEQYRGKPVLVDFWATWCPYCVKQMPDIKAAYQKYHDKGFEVVGISRDRKREALVEYIAKHDLPWQQYFAPEDDPDLKIFETYGIYGIPATFLLDADGRIVAKNPTPAQLDQHLATLLSQ